MSDKPAGDSTPANAVLSLRGNTAATAKERQSEIHDRVITAGVEVIEARISHLAYAPEIAGAMLRRQQAQPVVNTGTLYQ